MQYNPNCDMDLRNKINDLFRKMIDTYEPKIEGEYGCVPIRRNYSLYVPLDIVKKLKTACGFIAAKEIREMTHTNLPKRFFNDSFVGSVGNFFLFTCPILKHVCQVVIIDTEDDYDEHKRFDDKKIEIHTFPLSDIINT